MNKGEFIANEGRGGGVVGASEPPRTSEGSCGSGLFLVPTAIIGSLHGGSAWSVSKGSNAALNAAQKNGERTRGAERGMVERK